MNVNLFIGALAQSADAINPNIAERLGEGAVVLVQGLLTVFGVLAILWGVLALFKVFFYNIPEKRKNKKENNVAAAEAPVTETSSALHAVSASDNADEGVIVAAITAALSEYFAESGEYSGGFRVVSFRKSQSGSAWNKK